MTDATISRRRPERSSRTREAIIEAAAHILAREGYEGTSLEEVALAAGVVRATVYYHFASKEALYEAVILAAGTTGVRHVTEAVEGGGSDREVFLRFLAGNIAETLDPASRYIYQYELVRTDPETRRRVRASQRAYVEAVADIIRQGQEAGEFLAGDPKVLAYLVIGAVGSLTRWFRQDGAVSTDDIREIVARLVLPTAEA